MTYETPRLDEIGAANQLIQAHVGPAYDGDGYTFSQATVCSELEQE